MIKAALFDLDGTLLPMDMDEFTKGYFALLAKWMAPYGFEARGLVDAVWAGTKAMVVNDGSRANEEAFWAKFAEIYGRETLKNRARFEEFYRVGFPEAKAFCGYTPLAAKAVKAARDAGLRVALATNPLFPAVATRERARWAGVDAEEFELYTTYENIGFCKPNLEYYREVLRRMGLSPEEALMVGNDAGEDMVAEKLGMSVFLLTDCLLNRSGADISRWPHGGFPELMEHIRAVTK